MSNTKLVFKEDVLIIKTLVGVVSLACGIIVLITGSLYGFILCGLSFFYLYLDGSEIDFETNKYRTFTEVFGIRYGKWKELPEIDYVSVFSTTESVIVRSRSAEAKVRTNVVVVNLFYHGNHRIKAYTAKKKEKAFQIAKQIAEILKIDILDATEAESKWI
ncbi:hypothetical protein [uncultured Kordia sp.]|uniref:hypothetical protein n=1 Tax=uncultured Kordia sp. TaxID=507699 RepID=UPI00261534B7|nr:hypothetical protein [uncultured Kordia sp.]